MLYIEDLRDGTVLDSRECGKYEMMFDFSADLFYFSWMTILGFIAFRAHIFIFLDGSSI